MLRHDVSPPIPFTVRPPSTGACMRPISVGVLLILMPGFIFFPFSLRCSNRNYRQQWDVLNGAKSRILEMVYAQHTPAGVRIAAIKFMQRVILVQTRGVTDPRVRPIQRSLNATDSRLWFHFDLMLIRWTFSSISPTAPK